MVYELTGWWLALPITSTKIDTNNKKLALIDDNKAILKNQVFYLARSDVSSYKLTWHIFRLFKTYSAGVSTTVVSIATSAISATLAASTSASANKASAAATCADGVAGVNAASAARLRASW